MTDQEALDVVKHQHLTWVEEIQSGCAHPEALVKFVAALGQVLDSLDNDEDGDDSALSESDVHDDGADE